ncbi:MAG: heparinase II/III family protein [Deltaproteobacteria bacterium]|nr:heparinase II/III family protein [Deltaproteobacteria bacterium]
MRPASSARAALVAALILLGGCGGSPAGQADAGLTPLDDGCGATPSLAWIAALRARALEGPGALVSPGVSLDEARSRLEAEPTAQALVARARTQLEQPDPELAVGDAETYQVVASRALAAAFVAWVDGDAALTERARGLLTLAAVDDAWLASADEVPIRVGGAVVALAGAVDLLAAGRLLAADGVAAARRDVGQAARALDAWARLQGPAFLLATSNNHNVRLGAGLVAAGLVTGADDLDDEAVAYGLAQIVSVLHDSQGGQGAGWAEGPTYFAYGFEVAAAPLAALVPAWPLPGRGCLSCPGHTAGPCAETRVMALLPLGDEVLRGAIEWMASLETLGGWYAPVDDSRLGGVPAPLLERLADARLFRAWSPDGPGGSLGGSVDVGPFVAFALAAPPLAHDLTPAAVWPSAGSARVDLTGGDGTRVEAFLFAEGYLAQRGRGHERPDPLSLVVAVDGRLLLGASGYGTYEERAALARADSSSLITVDGRLPFDEGITAPGPGAVMTALDGGAQGQLTVPDVEVLRTLRAEGSEVVIQDLLQLAAPHEIGWHWHLRGEVVAGPDGSGWTWRRDGRTCVALQSGGADWLTAVLETAPNVDQYGVAEEHPVVRQRASLAPGDYSLVTLIACSIDGG